MADYNQRMKDLDSQIATVTNEIAQIQDLIASGHTGPSAEDLQIKKYEAAAKVMMGFDPTQAQTWMGKADDIRKNREMFGIKQSEAAAKQAMAQKKFGMDEVKQLAVQYRNARLSKSKDVYANLSEGEKANVEQELSGIKSRLMQDPFGKYLVGAVDKNPNLDVESVDPEAVTQPSVTAPVTEKLNVQDLRSDYKQRVIDRGEDAVIQIKAEISDLAEIHGDTKVSKLNAYVSLLEEDIEKKRVRELKAEDLAYGRSERKRLEGKGEYKDLKTRAYKQKPMYTALSDFRKSPDDVSVRSNALNLVLRKESGAAIGSNEYASKLQTWLGDTDYKAYIADLGGWKGYLAIKAGAGEQLALSKLAEYLGKVDPDKIETSLNSYLEDDVIGFYEKGSKEPDTTEERKVVSSHTLSDGSKWDFLGGSKKDKSNWRRK